MSSRSESAQGRCRPMAEVLEPRRLLAALVWGDEFSGAVGSAPDSTRWGYDLGGGGWGNSEWEVYTNKLENAAIAADAAATDGKALQITAIKQSDGTYTSARLKTQGKMSIAYGRWEARAKLPYGQGIWPAIWMLGSDIGTAGWPSCGELDIMENIGREPSAVHGTLHGPGYSGGNGLGSTYTLANGAKFADAYHVFAVEWSPTTVRFYVDGNLYRTRTRADLPAGTNWVYDHPFFGILNLAVGGTWPGYPDDTTVFPQKFLMDYFRVYSNMPTGWSDAEIGAPAPGKPGGAGIDVVNGVWGVTGGGADTWNNSDQFNFASQSLSGDGSITALITGMDNTNEWAKSGVMFRDSTAANAKNVAMVVSAQHGVQFQWRSAAGAASSAAPAVAGISTPVWVKLRRSGDTFAGYYSADGQAWTQVGTQSVDLQDTALAGLAVTAHDNGLRNTAMFTNVAVVPAGWEDADVGGPGLGGSAVGSGVGGVWTVGGGGTDIWNAADQFHFASRALSADGEIIARVGGVTNTDIWAKAGVMFRGSTSGDAPFAAVVQMPSNEVMFEYRTASGANAQATAKVGGTGTAKWVRLVRSGSSVSAYYATTSGTPVSGDWIQIGTAQTIGMANVIRAGLAVTSHSTAAVATATLSGVSVNDSLPVVQSFAVNGGAAQRSMVKQLAVSFSEPVVLGSGLSLRVHGGGAVANVSLVSNSADRKSYTLSFNSSAVVGGSLPDGVYDLVLSGAAVADDTGNAVASDAVWTFHRLFGDSDGNRIVNALDYARLKQSFGRVPSDPLFNSAFDYEGNGLINALDLARFRQRYGMSFSY